MSWDVVDGEAAELLGCDCTRLNFPDRIPDHAPDCPARLVADRVAVALRERDERIARVVSERDVVRCALNQSRERIAALEGENERLAEALHSLRAYLYNKSDPAWEKCQTVLAGRKP